MKTKSTIQEGESGWADSNRVSRRTKNMQPKNTAPITFDLSNMSERDVLKSMIIGEVLATPRCKTRRGGKK